VANAGRPSLGYTADMPHFPIPQAMADALGVLAETSGLSRTALARVILAEHLVDIGLLSEAELAALPLSAPSNNFKKKENT